jgi:hypothetical protein
MGTVPRNTVTLHQDESHCPSKKNETIDYFAPDVDPFADVDPSVFDQLSQDAKMTTTKPSQSPVYNPYLPENHNKNKPMDSIEIKKEQLASVEPTQVLHCKKPVAPQSENTNSEEAIDVDEVMLVANSDNNLKNSPNMLPAQTSR